MTFSSFAAISPACWFADVARTTIYLWFGSLLMFGSFTKSTRRHGGSHRVVALEGALKTIINDFPHEHCSIAKNLLRGWPFTFCCPLLWKTRRSIIVCGRGKEARNSCCWLENDSSMPLWTPKGTQVINMPRWRPCLWSLSFFFRVPWSSPV